MCIMLLTSAQMKDRAPSSMELLQRKALSRPVLTLEERMDSEEAAP